MITKTFEQFAAAERWCAEQGISVGRMQGPDPRCLLWGDFDIAKWRNLTKAERAECHGTMTGGRDGPIHVRICERPADLPAPAVEAAPIADPATAKCKQEELLLEQGAEYLRKCTTEIDKLIECHEFSNAAMKARDLSVALERLNERANALADAS